MLTLTIAGTVVVPGLHHSNRTLESKDLTIAFRTFAIVGQDVAAGGAMLGIVAFQGWLAYTVIGDLGMPDWDYRSAGCLR
jgi:hypothetical protein